MCYVLWTSCHGSFNFLYSFCVILWRTSIRVQPEPCTYSSSRKCSDTYRNDTWMRHAIGNIWKFISRMKLDRLLTLIEFQCNVKMIKRKASMRILFSYKLEIRRWRVNKPGNTETVKIFSKSITLLWHNISGSLQFTFLLLVLHNNLLLNTCLR